MRASFRGTGYVPTVVGTPEQCKARIEGFLEEYGVDEVFLLDIAPDRARRIKSAELLAQAFDLQPRNACASSTPAAVNVSSVCG
jgi:alkanesulfonate monooxygenase SsuD/methylene tetrahydromethanopterin reductase-like flavin-dependent oxidoreductase (luciferase family)